ncbi:MAG: FAD-binding oxidoreductase [Gemmatimonadaceae bacterium]|nr:FAD-binding oxidoreductase [Gemmatimonadaceae bacterium]
MNRRLFLKAAAAMSVLASGCSQALQGLAGLLPRTKSRVRPGDPLWPSDATWDDLRRAVLGRLIRVDSPLGSCSVSPHGSACTDVIRQLKNPFYIGDQPALTQTFGWIDGWRSSPSVYAVSAASTGDVVAAVNFARDHNLRVVVKGGGHSYQGTSSSPDSLLIWTRTMNEIVMHDAFVPRGAGTNLARPAVSVGAGAMWGQVYEAVTTRGGRFVQGGGCTTVGVAGLIQSGGFGSFSRRYGLAAAGLLEAEVVTADGVARIANAVTNPDLFWALKGGGGGSFGIVTRVTLKTRDLPENVGAAFGTIRVNSEPAFRRLTAHLVSFYHDRLFNPHWGEQLRFTHDAVQIQMVFQGMTGQQAEELWKPVVDWVTSAPQDFVWEAPLVIANLPARHLWDAEFLKQNVPQLVVADDRLGASPSNFFWAGDGSQAGQFVHGYRSAWLPASLLETERQSVLTDALVAASRSWTVSLHFNKGLARASTEGMAAARDTAMNPVVLDAFALAIIAGESQSAFPGVPGHEPDLAAARRDAAAINRAMDQLLRPVPDSGSYVSESDFFERDWQRSFWGSNYPRLLAIKTKYDPDGLFFVHHGVGSEVWSSDGFTRLAS